MEKFKVQKSAMMVIPLMETDAAEIARLKQDGTAK